MPTKDELRERLDELGAEQPAADAKKEDLEKAVADAEAAEEEAKLEVPEADPVEREQEVALEQAQHEAEVEAEQEANEDGADPEEVEEAVADVEVDEEDVDPLPDRLASAPSDQVREPDYSDYPPPLGEREAQQGEAWESELVYPQKGVLYTDGLSGRADSNLERAYEIPEELQSSDDEEREAGDESNSVQKDEE